MSDFSFTTTSETETHQFGARIATCLEPNDVLALSGDLGAGKTNLCKGIASGFGIDPDIVNSPTFVLLQQYEGTELVVHHFDTYRLGDVSEFQDIGGPDFFEAGGVCLVEWPERIEEELPDRTLWIGIEAVEAESRQITIADRSSRAALFLASLSAGMGDTGVSARPS